MDEYRDGSDAGAAWEHACALARGERTARWGLLDRANLMRFVRGRTRLDAWLADVEDCLTSYLGTASDFTEADFTLVFSPAITTPKHEERPSKFIGECHRFAK